QWSSSGIFWEWRVIPSLSSLFCGR
ncbi:hypothetical protein A2U01_0107298, partial [Trifolium medium]|nr:hypothetical protein [Trifolium medium]